MDSKKAEAHVQERELQAVMALRKQRKEEREREKAEQERKGRLIQLEHNIRRKNAAVLQARHPQAPTPTLTLLADLNPNLGCR